MRIVTHSEAVLATVGGCGCPVDISASVGSGGAQCAGPGESGCSERPLLLFLRRGGSDQRLNAASSRGTGRPQSAGLLLLQ